jgi:methyl-accepting chemotaxis protein
MIDPQLFSLLINVMLVAVVGIIGWLIKRAISGNDAKIEEAIKQINGASKSIGDLHLLIVGDYYPRKEHAEYARHMDSTMDQMRNNIHNLRDSLQTITSKMSALEVIVQSLKEQAEAILVSERQRVKE